MVEEWTGVEWIEEMGLNDMPLSAIQNSVFLFQIRVGKCARHASVPPGLVKSSALRSAVIRWIERSSLEPG
jgi:hypothetical protein